MKTDFPTTCHCCGSRLLTARQKQVLELIVEMTAKHGRPPSLREMMVPLGVTGVCGVQRHLVALQRKGWVDWKPGKSRTLRIVPQPQRRGMPLVTLGELKA